ncbi:hypothetical protein GA0070615_6318 [Micromonospora aurantiaca]|nr:hypothetical protein GA0070615_6318 [Micromonospora aurantiaca]
MASARVRTAPGRRVERARRPHVALAVVLILAGVFATGAGLGSNGSGSGLLGWLPFVGQRGSAEALGPSRPVRISIDAIKVNAAVGPVGVAADGSIAVPPL